MDDLTGYHLVRRIDEVTHFAEIYIWKLADV